MTKSPLSTELPVSIKKCSFDEYKNVRAFSAHSSRDLLLEPCKWLRGTNSPTKEMEFGTAVHYAVLECVKDGLFDKELFEREYAIKPDCNAKTKEGKTILADFEIFCEENNKKPISSEDFKKISTMADALLFSSAKIFFGYQLDDNMEAFREISMFWKYKNDKGKLIDCKARADAIVVDYERKLIVIADLKTTKNASPKEFAKDCTNYGYGWQSAWYSLPFINDGWTVSFIAIAIDKGDEPTIGIYDLKEFGDIELQNVQEFLESCDEISDEAKEMTCYYKIESPLEAPAWFKGTRKSW